MERETKAKRILFVDDDLDILAVIKRGLEHNGKYAVDAASDPLLVLGGYQPGRYDLLLIDYKMPGINGFELYKKIYEIDKEVKVCFLTALETKMEEYKKKFPSWKGVCFATKPVTMRDLDRKMAELMQN
jgi:DNA-binding response OmpR family regulator